MNMKYKLATVYYPQTNRLTEQFNKTLCQTLAKYIHDYEDIWDIFIPSALFAYQTILQLTTKYDLFELIYRRKANTSMDLKFISNQSIEEPLYE